MGIKENIKTCRKKENISVLKLSKCVGIDESVIRRIESGETKDPRISNVMKLSKHFHVSLDDFVYKDLSKENQ